HFAAHPRALIGGLVAIAAQARHVQEYVGHPVVRNDEAVSLCDIEPFDDARDLDDTGCRLIVEIDIRSEFRLGEFGFDSVRRHDAAAAAFSMSTPEGALHESLESRLTLAIQG